MKPTHQESLQDTDIGHGMGGAVLWMAVDRKIQVANQEPGAHESIWGAEAAMQCWRGRFVPETDRLSIAYPVSIDSQSPVPDWLIDALRARFGVSVTVFCQYQSLGFLT
jgi:hypothetical protein